MGGHFQLPSGLFNVKKARMIKDKEKQLLWKVKNVFLPKILLLWEVNQQEIFLRNFWRIQYKRLLFQDSFFSYPAALIKVSSSKSIFLGQYFRGGYFWKSTNIESLILYWIWLKRYLTLVRSSPFPVHFVTQLKSIFECCLMLNISSYR